MRPGLVDYLVWILLTNHLLDGTSSFKDILPALSDTSILNLGVLIWR